MRLRALSDASRFRILQLLQGGAQHVGAVATAIGLSQSCTTRHLQVLERAALVLRSPRGRQVEVALSAEARTLLASLVGAPALGGADLHADAGPSAVGDRATRRPQRDGAARRPAVTRASPPQSDTPPSTEPAAPTSATPPSQRSRIEEFLL